LDNKVFDKTMVFQNTALRKIFVSNEQDKKGEENAYKGRFVEVLIKCY